MRRALGRFYLTGLICAAAGYGQQYLLSTVAGGAPPPTPGLALSSAIGAPNGIGTDGLGNVYFLSLNCLFKVDSAGILTRVAGTSRSGYSGDGGPAIAAQIRNWDPSAVAIDNRGSILFADNFRIRRVAPDGTIATIADSNLMGTDYVISVSVDRHGNTYGIDQSGRIVRISTSGVSSLIAGTGQSGFSGDGGKATSATLNRPSALAVDSVGNLYIADNYNFRIRRVSVTGIITTFAGTGMDGFSGDGGLATAASFSQIFGLAMDNSDNLYFADSGNHRVRRITPDGIISTVAGIGNSFNQSFDHGAGYAGDGGPAINARLNVPNNIAVDGRGNLYISDSSNLRVRRVGTDGIITTVAGNGMESFSGDGGSAIAAQLDTPQGLARDVLGNIYIADRSNHRIRAISPKGIITTVVGNGVQGFSGDGGAAVLAELNYPSDVAVDKAGNIYIADSGNSRIRQVSAATGTIRTIAGTGARTFGGNGGLATKAQLSPSAIDLDNEGNIYVGDSFNHRVLKISTDGIVNVIAGTGVAGSAGDGSPAIAAQFTDVTGIAVDRSGSIVYFADYFNNVVRKIDTNGILSTVATGSWAVALDLAGNLYLGYGQLKKIAPSGVETVIAFTGGGGYSGDGNAALLGTNNSLLGILVDETGQIYVSDSYNSAIRLIEPTNQPILVSAVVDAASAQVAALAPGKIVVLYGAGLGPKSLVTPSYYVLDDDTIVGTELAGTRVQFNDVYAPILYTSASQVAAIVPYEISGSTVLVTATYDGHRSASVTLPLANSSPSLFTIDQTGANRAAAVNFDPPSDTLNSPSKPVRVGGYISLYLTGEGTMIPSGVTGRITIQKLSKPALPVSVTVGGVPALVTYAGSAPGSVTGLTQVNVQIPAGVEVGPYVPVLVKIGEASTQTGVWIAVSN